MTVTVTSCRVSEFLNKCGSVAPQPVTWHFVPALISFLELGWSSWTCLSRVAAVWSLISIISFNLRYDLILENGMNFSISNICLEASFFERECAPKITLKSWTFSCRVRQWDADSTHWGWISTPPQRWWPRYWMEAMNGRECGDTSRPPIISMPKHSGVT